MGVNHNDSKSDNYQLKETRQDELGKTFVYDRVEDNIDEETFALDKTRTFHVRLGASSVLINLLIIPVLIIVGFNAYTELFAPQARVTGNPYEDKQLKLTGKLDGEWKKLSGKGHISKRWLFGEEIPVLMSGKRLNSSVSLEDKEQSYRFKLANPSSISLSLDGVNSEVEMFLYSDKDGTGVIGGNYGYTSAIKSKPGIISKELGAGNYIVVVRLKAKGSNYTLMMSTP